MRSRHYQVIWIYCTNYPGREVPIVLMENGRPGYVINQWIAYLLDEEITPSRLELYVRALCHLYDFVLSQRETVNYTDFTPEGRILLADFIDAKKYGTDNLCIQHADNKQWLKHLGLNWKPLTWRKKTITQYINAINQFDKWQITFHSSTAINPSEQKVLTAFEKYRDFIHRIDWDPFLHLHPSKAHNKTEHQISAYGRYEHRRNEQAMNGSRAPKAFPLNKFPDLIRASENPRDKLLWLLMGAGSLRASETLHLFLSDVEGDPKSDGVKILLEDPEYGYVRWSNDTGNEQYTTRSEYFNRQFQNEKFSANHPLRNLRPRSQYGQRNNRLHAGFKGMTFGENAAAESLLNFTDNQNHIKHYIWWIDPHASALFRNIHLKYQQTYFWQNPSGWPWHPWLLIATNPNNYGMPLSMSALKQTWRRALKRVGMENSGFGMHSLRHMYGYYCANILKQPVEITQVMMHHASIQSTQVYYSLESSTIHNSIQSAVSSNQTCLDWSKLIEEKT